MQKTNSSRLGFDVTGAPIINGKIISSLKVMSLSQGALILMFIAAMVLFYFNDANLFSIVVGIIGNLIFLFFYIIQILALLIMPIIFRDKKQETFSNNKNIADSDLPIYTILLPLYKEKRSLNKLIRAINNIDYPRNKLDIKILLEEVDTETIIATRKMKLPKHFTIVIVPDSYPRTKPKACNYGLKSARGKYVTIYDAEDIPDKMQLKKAVWKFAESDEKVVCLQAVLCYYNRYSNMLTRLFSIEYYWWFQIMMPACRFMQFPIPLGGTSNHIKLSKLCEIGGWDAYNVAEDAELGVRIKLAGYEVGILHSKTEEEAVSRMVPWIKQRSRWVKGFLQTLIAHTKQPIFLIKKVGLHGFIYLNLLLGWPVFSLLLLAVLLCSDINAETNQLIYYISLFNMFAYIFLSIAIVIISYFGLRDFGKQNTSISILNFLIDVIIFPFYRMLCFLALIKSIYEMFTSPHKWDKTEHFVQD